MAAQQISEYEQALFRHIFWYRTRKRAFYMLRVLLWLMAALLAGTFAWSWWMS